MRILFLHGWHSKPGGTKPTFLVNYGHEVLNPALPNEDFDEAVSIAQAELDRQAPDVVIGSSRGGAVAANLELGDTPLLLLCPAWKNWGRATRVGPNTIILHGTRDETIPFAHSQELLANSGLDEARLVAVDDNHRLGDSLEVMVECLDALRK
tara:strand:- start:8122 stop:8580 length:459 start_codon:yes stop_codon:yes gene_type:complete